MVQVGIQKYKYMLVKTILHVQASEQVGTEGARHIKHTDKLVTLGF